MDMNGRAHSAADDNEGNVNGMGAQAGIPQ